MSFYMIPVDSKGQDHYINLVESSDASFIENAINSGVESDMPYLCKNPHLSDKHLEALGNSPSEFIRSHLANRRDLSSGLVKKLQADPSERVRVSILCNPLTDSSYFKNAVLTEKFSPYYFEKLSMELKVVESVDTFKLFWTKLKSSRGWLTMTLSLALKGYKGFDHAKVDPGCITIVHDAITSGKASRRLREDYVGCPMVSNIPEILDTLKDDAYRPVINGLAGNPNAWPSTHEYLVDNHKTPAIRISVARATRDHALLNKIYHGTKSKEIREAVQKNPVFVNLKP